MAHDDLLQTLESLGVPAGPINTVGEALEDPQIAAREMVVEMDRGANLPPVRGLRSPLRFSQATLATSRPSPVLGSGDLDALRAEFQARTNFA